MPYLDNASTKSIYGNPSSLHSYGIRAWRAIQESREAIAKFIKCDPSEVYFTSGATEANNWALIGGAQLKRFEGNHIITTKIEHPSIINTCKFLEEFGFEVTYLNVDKNGRVNIKELKKELRPTTIIVSIMTVNNEIGTIEPISECKKIVKEYNPNILFHTDVTQALGNIKIYTDVDLLSMSFHKLDKYAPMGSGALVIKNGIDLPPFIHGGHQERGKRAGTENFDAINDISRIFYKLDVNANIEQLCKLNYHLKEKLKKINGLKFIVDNVYCSPSIINIRINGVNSEALVILASTKKLYISAGSACNSGSGEPSYVLKAIGLSDDEAGECVRLSLSPTLTMEDIDEAYDILVECINQLRGEDNEA